MSQAASQHRACSTDDDDHRYEADADRSQGCPRQTRTRSCDWATTAFPHWCLLAAEAHEVQADRAVMERVLRGAAHHLGSFSSAVAPSRNSTWLRCDVGAWVASRVESVLVRPKVFSMEAMYAMSGQQRDAITDYSTPASGSYYFAPSVETLDEYSDESEAQHDSFRFEVGSHEAPRWQTHRAVASQIDDTRVLTQGPLR